MEVPAIVVVMLVRYNRVVFVLQVRRVERCSGLWDMQDPLEVNANALTRLERRSNVVAAAARLALMALGEK